jgi:transposase
MVTSGMQQNGLGWDIFIFLNRRRNQIKLLLFEGDGFAIYHKRLEKGTYFWRKCEQIDKVQKQKSLQIKGFAGF